MKKKVNVVVAGIVVASVVMGGALVVKADNRQPVASPVGVVEEATEEVTSKPVQEEVTAKADSKPTTALTKEEKAEVEVEVKAEPVAESKAEPKAETGVATSKPVETKEDKVVENEVITEKETIEEIVPPVASEEVVEADCPTVNVPNCDTEVVVPDNNSNNSINSNVIEAIKDKLTNGNCNNGSNVIISGSNCPTGSTNSPIDIGSILSGSNCPTGGNAIIIGGNCNK